MLGIEEALSVWEVLPRVLGAEFVVTGCIRWREEPVYPDVEAVDRETAANRVVADVGAHDAILHLAAASSGRGQIPIGGGVPCVRHAYTQPHCLACVQSASAPGFPNLAAGTTSVTVTHSSDPNMVMKTRDLRRRAYWVVDDFEEALADYCGSPYAVTVSSCTAALFLALTLDRVRGNVRPDVEVQLPTRTYIGVLRAVRHAGFGVYWNHEPWQGRYWLSPTRVVDAARDFRRGCHEPGRLVCLSFHIAKQLPLGEGGAILCDSAADASWLRAARSDGRWHETGEAMEAPYGWHHPMPPDVAARGLWMLETVPDDPADRSHSYDLYDDVSLKHA